MTLLRLHGDFNGLFGEYLCLSHEEKCRDSSGTMVAVTEGMPAMAVDDDGDEDGIAMELIAAGTIVRSPDWLQCLGSRWCLLIDARGVRQEPKSR